MIRSFVGSLCALALFAGTAQGDRRDRNVPSKQELDAFERDMQPVAPGPGRDRAPVRPPPWCDGVAAETGYTLSGVRRQIESSQKHGWTGLLTAARVTCSFANVPAIGKAVAAIEQEWINITGLPEAQALATFKLRLQEDRLKADKAKLCEAIEIPAEWEGEDKWFATARRQVFGCVQKGYADKHAMWADRSERVSDELLQYLDLSSNAPDELARLAQVLTRASYIHGEKGVYFDQELTRYTVDQFDFKALSAAKLMKLLETAPYQNNTYARTVITESIGRAQMGIAAIEAEVAKKAADADWKELLVTAPRRGFDAWTKSAETWKDQLARSNAFERTFYGPSRKANEGCMKTLLPDFLAIAKTLETKSVVAFKEALSTDLIANLMYIRLATCARLDGQGSWSEKLFKISGSLRSARGPRVAAHYAAFDALSKILADRAKFPVEHKHLSTVKTNALYHAAMKVSFESKGAGMGSDGKGVVKAVKPTAAGVQVTFVADKHKEMSYDCTPTSQIIMFTADGRPLYYQNCKPAGMVTIDNTAKPMTVAKEWAAGIAPGTVVEFEAEYGDKPERKGIPVTVYTDKTKTKLVNYYGMSLAR